MIGIFGGTFDPVHYGHLRPALEVQQALGLAEVRFVPLAEAVHRGQPAGTAAQRLAMVRAAVAGQPGFVVDDREIRRGGRSYTLDTLKDMRAEKPQTPLCLFVGGDAFEEFLTWHEPLGILDLAHVVVMRRPGSGAPSDPALAELAAARACAAPTDLAAAPAGRILFQPVPRVSASSCAKGSRRATCCPTRYCSSSSASGFTDTGRYPQAEPGRGCAGGVMGYHAPRSHAKRLCLLTWIQRSDPAACNSKRCNNWSSIRLTT